jgi:hypothetical protein
MLSYSIYEKLACTIGIGHLFTGDSSTDDDDTGADNSGFKVDCSVRVRAGDRKGRENISRYLLRAPFLVDKIQYSCREGSVLLDFLTAVTAHISDRREHLVR